MISCKKDPAVLVPPVFKINITPSSMIAYGGSATISVISKNTDYITVNGKAFPLSFETGALFQTTDFEIIAFNSDGTTKETVTVSVDKAPLPILEVTYSKDPLIFGGKTKFSWKASGLVSFLTLDGVSVGNPDSFNTPTLYKTTEYNLTVTGPGGSITEKITITVGDWKTSQIGLITYNNPSWTAESIDIPYEYGVFHSLYTNGGGLSFNIDGTFTSFGVLGNWQFSDDGLYVIVGHIIFRKIVKLTPTEFSWIIKGYQSGGVVVDCQQNFKRVLN